MDLLNGSQDAELRPRMQDSGLGKPPSNVSETASGITAFSRVACRSLSNLAQLRERLEAQRAEPCELVVTDNTHSMISARRTRGVYRVRLHHMFETADPETLEALYCYLVFRERQANAVLSAFIETRLGAIRGPRAQLQPQGAVHDLSALAASLWGHFSSAECKSLEVLRFGWGLRESRASKSASLKLGSYSDRTHQIRIHQRLDVAWVPARFVAFVLHHEFLHHLIPAQRQQGRRVVHPPAFRAREQAHPDYVFAQEWQRLHLETLLESPSRLARVRTLPSQTRSVGRSTLTSAVSLP